MVELLLAKQVVVGSIPILRSKFALLAQLVEVSVLETEGCKFESYIGHQFRRNSSVGRAVVSYAACRKFDPCFRHHLPL